MNDEELRRLHTQAQAALGAIPGVVGVGLGLKERSGVVTDEVALRVYVREKKERSRLSNEERVPEEFLGVPTDVLIVREAIPHGVCEDRAKHNPIVGGISISPQRAPGWVGTLGFFATINGVGGPNNVVLVTNHHVLAHGGGQVGDIVYQPDRNLGNTSNNPIAKIHAMP